MPARNPNIDYSHDVYPDDKWFGPQIALVAPSTSNSNPVDPPEVENHTADHENSVIEEPPELPVAHISTNLVAFGRLVKRAKKFGVTTEAEFDMFCEVHPIISKVSWRSSTSFIRQIGLKNIWPFSTL